jgi:hypothetical protein
MKTNARQENKGHLAYDIESVGSLAVARQHLKELARSAAEIALFIPRKKASSSFS